MRFAYPYPLWNLVAWAVWAAGFAILETMGVRSSKYTTLTNLTLRTVPAPFLAMFLGWLAYHFLIQYIGKR